MREFVLENRNGLKLRVSEFGATAMELHVPDAKGGTADVLLGFDSIEGFQASDAFFGALVGRYANRIAKGRFELEGSTYLLERNNGENHLHGGGNGFHKQAWQGVETRGDDYAAARFTRRSVDGEEGYPGNIDVSVGYRITDANEWIIEYEARTDRPTIVNLTQHAYFNLAGHGSGDVSNHTLRLNALAITPVDAALIPTGEFASVENGPFDFRSPKSMGSDIDASDEQIELGGGYDHNFVIDRPDERGGLAKAAAVGEPHSGRTMEVLTTEPGVQFYTGNFLDGSELGKGGVRYRKRGGFCLETQRFPDSPNQPHFPSARLDPGETYRSKTVYCFAWK